MSDVIRKKITSLPNFGQEIDYDEMPVFTAEDYEDRIHRLFAATGQKYDYFLVYGDREHFSNMEYFSGYDPRFEESILLLSKTGKKYLIMGVEAATYAAKIPYKIQCEVYPPLSIPCYSNQMSCGSNDSGVTLKDIFLKCGISAQCEIGVLGWKLFRDDKTFDIPEFIMSALLEITDRTKLTNVNQYMIDNAFGLRHTLELKELILTELAGTKASRSVYNVFKNCREGMREIEASAYMALDADPLNMHPNVNFGENAFWGLASPSHHRKLKEGDLVVAGLGYRRSVCFKISQYIGMDEPHDPQIEEYFDVYFKSLSAWYESLRLGNTGGTVYANIEKEIGNLSEYGIGINTGHLIHTDEWTNSPFYKGNDTVLHSGMALESDYSAYRPDLGIAIHEEDGVILMDAELAAQYQKTAPKSYARMLARREFMRNVLNIRVGDEVFLVSDHPGVIFPYLKNMDIVLANA